MFGAVDIIQRTRPEGHEGVLVVGLSRRRQLLVVGDQVEEALPYTWGLGFVGGLLVSDPDVAQHDAGGVCEC